MILAPSKVVLVKHLATRSRVLFLCLLALLLQGTGCTDRSASAPANSDQLNALADERSAAETIDYLIESAWRDFVNLPGDASEEDLNSAKKGFSDYGRQAYSFVVDIVSQPSTSSREKLKGAELLSHMAAAVTDPDLTFEAVLVLLECRQQAESVESESVYTECLATVLPSAILANPKKAQLYFFQGQEYEMQGQLDPAIAEFSQAVDINPDFGVALLMRGRCLVAKGEYDAAKPDFDRVIQLDSENATGYLYHAVCSMKAGNNDNALEDLNTAIEKDPAYAAAYEVRASLYQAMGNELEAMADNEKAAELRSSE